MRFVDEQGLSRHLVRSEPGEDLLAALAELATSQQWQRALVIGAGVLELVEVRDPEGALHTLEHAQLVALSGTVTAEGSSAAVMLLGTMISGAQLVSGRLVEAVAGDMLLRIDGVVSPAPAEEEAEQPAAEPPLPIDAIDAIDGIDAIDTLDTEPPVALRSVDLTPATAPATGPEPDSEPDTVEDEVPVPEQSTTPSDPAPASEPTPGRITFGPIEPPAPLSAPKPPSRTFRTRPIPRRIPSRPNADWDDDVAPDEGDYLRHPQLGLCKVEGTDERGGTIIVVPSGRRRTLHLDALKVLPGEDDDEGRHVFKVVGPRR